MRKFFVVSRQLLAVGCMLIANAAIAQSGYYTRYFGDEALQQKADAWTASEVWRNGFNAAMPHESVNRIDFYQQYEKNPEQWKALFIPKVSTLLRALRWWRVSKTARTSP